MYMYLDQCSSLLQAVGVVDKRSVLVSKRSGQLSAVLIGPNGFKTVWTDLKPLDGFITVQVSNRSSTYAHMQLCELAKCDSTLLQCQADRILGGRTSPQQDHVYTIWGVSLGAPPPYEILSGAR